MFPFQQLLRLVEMIGGVCDGVTVIISMLVDLCCAFVPVRISVVSFCCSVQSDFDCRERGLGL